MDQPHVMKPLEMGREIIALRAKLKLARTALEVGRDAARECLVNHDGRYNRHPATEGAREIYTADLATIEKAIEELDK